MQTYLIAAIAVLVLSACVLFVLAYKPVRPKTEVRASSLGDLRQPFQTSIRLRSTNLSTKTEVIINKEDFLIGRGGHCDFVLDHDLGVSNEQCRIRYHQDSASYAIIDLDSENHTYINGKLLAPMREHRLEKGDVVTIVSYDFLVESAFKA